MAQKIITSQFCVTSVDDGRNGEKGNDGTSPWVADFDNEMDSVQCDDSGYVLEEQTVYTNVRLFYGNNAKMLTIVSVKRGSVSMGNGTEKNGVTVTWGATSSSVGISFKYKTTAKISGKDNYEIVLRSYDGESQNKTLYFTVNGVRGDVYNLLPSVDEIHATRDADGNYLINGGNTFAMTCGYSKRNLNGNVTRVTDVSARIDNKYNIYFNRHKRNGDWAGNWALYQNYKYALAMPGTTIGSNKGTLDPKTYDAIRFALCESTSNTVAVSTGLNGVIDEETVCIVADGDKGISIALVLNRTGESGYTESNWNSWATIGVTDTASKRDYDDDFTKCRVGDYYMIVGSSYDMKIYHEATYRCTKVSSSSITGVCISHIKDGSDGDGIQYVYKRFTTEQSNLSAPTKPSSMNADGEWIPSGWTDDPTGVNSTYKFEYVSCIKRIDGVWGNFEKPALWAKYGEKGDPGQDAVVATVSPDKVSVPCSFMGVVEENVPVTLTFSIKKGSTTYTPTSVAARSYNTGTFTVEAVSGHAEQKKLTVKKDAARSNLASGVTFDVTYNSGGVNITAPCTVSTIPGSKGEQGEIGHIGRWYEYAGAWGSGSVTSVTNTKHVGYFVKYVYNAPKFHYYINIKDDGVANTTTPADGTGKANSGWEQISDERMAIFTKVIFSENAYLGSFIFNNDWMISQQAASGSPQSSYTKFNPSYPNSNYNNSNFIPVLAINGKTGKVYMNDAVIRGTVYASNGSFSGTVNASSGTFNGTVHANSGYFKGGIFNPLQSINSGNISQFAAGVASGYYRIDSIPESCGGFQFEMTSKVYLYLPAPDASWKGREFEVLNLTEYASADVVIQTANVYGPYLTLKQYFYVKFKVVYDPVAGDYKWIKISSMNVNRGLATGDTEDGAHVEFGNVVTT